jgi:transcriptional regulator with XRE-family HTH domain
VSDVVALLLDDSMPAERLGALLRSARKRLGWKRREVEDRTGIPAALLRDYERGRLVVPPGTCARLAECYGDDLTAHVPLRVPVRLNDDRLVLGDNVRYVNTDDTDDVLSGYVEIVARLRRSKPGEPVALRATDVAALGAALSAETHRIETRIVALLGCSRAEAKALHAELLRRKVILPVAGLAASVVAFAGFSSAHADTPSGPASSPTEASATVTPPSTARTTSSTSVPTTAAPVTTVSIPSVSPAPPKPSPPSSAASSSSETSPPSVTDATVPPDQQAADVPPPDPSDDTPMSVPTGETVVIIGTPETTTQPTTPPTSADTAPATSTTDQP